MKKELLFEIGTEEIPAAALYKATDQLKALAENGLKGLGLSYESVETMSTPRRMILNVHGLADATEPQSIKAKGPAAKIAFDAEGNPSKAAQGFARGKGLTADSLVRDFDEKGIEYVYAIIEKPAVPALDLLPDLLMSFFKDLSWPRSQRWGSRRETFSRPVRWIVALFGADVIPLEFAGIKAGNTTYGHRFLAPDAVVLEDAESYSDVVFQQMKVVPSAQLRSEVIRQQITAFEESTGLRADTPAKTFAEVVNLVEYPTVLLCHFDERFLEVPPEIITDAMLEHQRYFPMYRQDGSLDNAFLVVSNGDPECSAVIADGNERVVRARLSDAEFFVREDRRKPLESYVEGLDAVVFQEKLGTVGAKTKRIVANVSAICSELGVSKQDEEDSLRAALLCKADLITGAVVEFTSLQGIMGGHYARYSGENDAVAQAVTEHYRPRFSGDDVPSNMAGKIVAFADKLDTICGLFAIGQGPTGSSDPYALRRAALGIINIMREGADAPLIPLIDAALSSYEEQGIEFDKEQARAAIIEFFVTRMKVILREEGIAAETIEAVLSVGIGEPMELYRRSKALETARAEAPETFGDLAIAYGRAANLADKEVGTDVRLDLLGIQESLLYEAVDAASHTVPQLVADGSFSEALGQLAALRGPIDGFFEAVMVNDPDEQLRTNRMRLLNRFLAVFSTVADFGCLGK